tara:strand:+ start:547 stop:783 length:237 start_codon:yes stop_codon:yes gene_type:complete
MIWRDLVLSKFSNGFRILNGKNTDDKFFVIDDVKMEIGDMFRVGPNGYFENVGNIHGNIHNEAIDDQSYASILYENKD